MGMFGVEFGVNDKLKRVYHVPYRVFCYQKACPFFHYCLRSTTSVNFLTCFLPFIFNSLAHAKTKLHEPRRCTVDAAAVCVAGPTAGTQS